MHVNLTRDLSSADVQAKKMEEVGRLAGGVAHDFANLMTLIAGYAEILSKRVNIADPLRPELEEIQKAANRGASMTAQLLDFIRRQVIQPTLLDLNALVRDMEGMLRPIIGEHIQLLTSYAPELGAVKADPGQMSRVILNLVLNARDAMPKGGRMVIETANVELQGSAAVARQLAPGEYVTMSLSDTGHGMDAEVMDHLFEPFFTTRLHVYHLFPARLAGNRSRRRGGGGHQAGHGLGDHPARGR
jgi:signal transduction histidine kinase